MVFVQAIHWKDSSCARCTLIIGEHLPEKTRQMWMSLGFRVCWFGAYAFSGLVDVCSRHNCQTEGERMIVPEEDPTPADFPVCERLTNLGIWQFWFWLVLPCFYIKKNEYHNWHVIRTCIAMGKYIELFNFFIFHLLVTPPSEKLTNLGNWQFWFWRQGLNQLMHNSGTNQWIINRWVSESWFSKV